MGGEEGGSDVPARLHAKLSARLLVLILPHTPLTEALRASLRCGPGCQWWRADTSFSIVVAGWRHPGAVSDALAAGDPVPTRYKVVGKGTPPLPPDEAESRGLRREQPRSVCAVQPLFLPAARQQQRQLQHAAGRPSEAAVAARLREEGGDDRHWRRRVPRPKPP